MTQEFVEYQQQVLKNAKALAEYLIERGFNLITNGTSNHLMLVDLRNKEMTGKEAEERLDEVGITVNKNSVPNDSERPTITSGIRIGTPAVTTRGMKEDDMAIIARVIDMIVGRKDAMYPKYLVEKLCKKYPIY
jgi:glycine hydroxymethyltransferase